MGCSSGDDDGDANEGAPRADGGGTSAAGDGDGGSRATGGGGGGPGGTSGTGSQDGAVPSADAGGDRGGGGEGDSGADGGGEDASGLVRTESPWGIAPSHSSSVGIESWASVIAESGIDWIRGYTNPSHALPIASSNGFEVSGILAFSDPGDVQTFPVNSIPEFQDYVRSALADGPSVKHFEVWNEPPNFSENKSPVDYAKIVVAAYEAAKAVDPDVQIGLAAQSVNLNFMAQALSAGAADHFDHVTVHPYETLGLVDDGWEAQFMSIVPTIRKLLADLNPAKQDVPIWFTELGEPVMGAITEEHQADTLVKAYVMGLAQGAHRIHWFEPLDGDSGPFGLIGGGDGSAPKRMSFVAVSKLIEVLGRLPRYVGWLLLNDAHYAFVFEGAGDGRASMVAWTAKGVTDTVPFTTTVNLVDLHEGDEGGGGVSVELTHSPSMIRGVPEELIDEARRNASKPLPWGGDYTDASSISYSAADGAKGLHPLGAPNVITLDGSPAVDVSQGPGLTFTIDPSFCSYCAGPLVVTAVVRRNGSDAAGFNLKYESTSGWQGTGSWYSVPGSDAWYTQSWTLDDAQLVGKWGYHIALDSDSTDNSDYSVQSVTVAKP